MTFKGVVKEILEARSGVSQAGKQWKSQDIVIEESGAQYPTSIVANIFNDKVVLPQIGDFVEAHLSPTASEYNGRYYQKISVWRLDVINPMAVNAVNTSTLIKPDSAARADDLPF